MSQPEDKSIEQRYRKLSDIEHVLLRPGMYVGSTKSREDEVWLLREDGLKLQKERVLYNPAFLKIFDEIVSNSVDEHRRNPKKLNCIRVEASQGEGWIKVWDNGGIPVVRHAEHNEWVPELIFSNLKAGSNFDDSESRLVAGTNGVGSTLTNIFSTEFRVRTCDGKQEFDQTFFKNMTDRTEAEVKPWEGGEKNGFTEITFYPDFSRFGMDGLDEAHLEMMKRRCLELAACNPTLRVLFSVVTPDPGQMEMEFKFSSFREFCNLYVDDVIYEEQGRWKVGFSPSEGSSTQVSFVNSVETRDGGTHVEYLIYQAVNWVREKLRKKHKLELKPGEIRNHFAIFVQADIVNPAFSSQTKEKLITESKDFGSRFEVSEDTLKKIWESEIVQRILDWAEQKALAEERKTLRDLNKNLAKGKVLKLIDAKARGNREQCTLALFEGDSASSAFRKFRDPNLQGAFPLRGKFLNVTELASTRVIQNVEVRDLMTALGLKMGEPPENLRYGKVLIYSDADPDGDSIAGLLVNFFGRYWPELFSQKKIYRVMTPLVVVEKGSEKIPFYTAEEFDSWQAERKDLSKWDIAYKKGLAALSNDDYEDIIKRPRMFALLPGHNLKAVLDCWFAGDVKPRKNKILGVLPPEEEEESPPPGSEGEPQPAVAIQENA